MKVENKKDIPLDVPKAGGAGGTSNQRDSDNPGPSPHTLSHRKEEMGEG